MKPHKSTKFSNSSPSLTKLINQKANTFCLLSLKITDQFDPWAVFYPERRVQLYKKEVRCVGEKRKSYSKNK